MKKKASNINEKGTPLSEKVESLASDPGFSLDPYKLAPDLQKELDDKGLVGRFLNLDLLEQNGGYHPKGWRPYKRDRVDNSDFAKIFGKDPDGYVRRGKSILGVKTKEEVGRHRAFLAQEAEKASYVNCNKRAKRAMKDHIRQNGLEDKIRVLDGYEE